MKRQAGFGAVMAIVVLVIFAALAASLVTVGTTQQLTAAQDVMSSRAWAAARSGSDWALYQALRNGVCNAANPTLDLSADTGFWVTVECYAKTYDEGPTTTVYRIDATACNSATCPDPAAAASPGYVERKREVIATN